MAGSRDFMCERLQSPAWTRSPDLLDGPRARGRVPAALDMDPPWSLRIEDEAPLTLVAVVRGEAWIVPDDGEPVRLAAGDVAIVRGPEPTPSPTTRPRAPQAVIHPGQRCTTPDGAGASREMMDLGVRTWGNAADGATVMLTGTYQLDGEVSRRLLRALPPLLVLRATSGTARSIPLLADEIVKDEPGQEAVLDRLLDLLLIAVLRAWFARPEADAPGVVPRLRRPGRRPRAADAAPQPVAPVDGGGAGRRDRRVARRAGAALQRAGRRAADDLPHRLAHRAGRRPAARARRHHRLGGRRRSATAARSR